MRRGEAKSIPRSNRSGARCCGGGQRAAGHPRAIPPTGWQERTRLVTFTMPMGRRGNVSSRIIMRHIQIFSRGTPRGIRLTGRCTGQARRQPGRSCSRPARTICTMQESVLSGRTARHTDASLTRRIARRTTQKRGRKLSNDRNQSP